MQGRISVRALLLLAIIALGVYGLDQLAKFLIVSHLHEDEVVPLLGPVLQFHYVTNSGAAFSFANGYTWIFSIVAVGVIVVIAWFARRIRSLAWAAMFGLVLGGALGNIRDRSTFGYVLDYADFHIGEWRPFLIFNIADAAITIGVVIILVRALFLREKHPATGETTAETAPDTAET